uniref:Uncharacterized protein n=1 Tax=Knipowitschia caucasica TaxID=637954 RepID=A0AAV2LCA0_KNICA
MKIGDGVGGFLGCVLVGWNRICGDKGGWGGFVFGGGCGGCCWGVWVCGFIVVVLGCVVGDVLCVGVGVGGVVVFVWGLGLLMYFCFVVDVLGFLVGLVVGGFWGVCGGVYWFVFVFGRWGCGMFLFGMCLGGERRVERGGFWCVICDYIGCFVVCWVLGGVGVLVICGVVGVFVE